MEVLDLSGEDEEYLSIEQLEKMEDIKISLIERMNKLEDKLNNNYDSLLKNSMKI